MAIPRLRIPLNALQKALYDRLRADLDSSIEITDGAPIPPRFPAVVIGGGDGAFGWRDKSGAEMTARPVILILSVQGGWEEANQIADEVLQSLSKDTLTLPPEFQHVGVMTGGDDDSIEWSTVEDARERPVRQIALRPEFTLRALG